MIEKLIKMLDNVLKILDMLNEEAAEFIKEKIGQRPVNELEVLRLKQAYASGLLIGIIEALSKMKKIER